MDSESRKILATEKNIKDIATCIENLKPNDSPYYSTLFFFDDNTVFVYLSYPEFPIIIIYLIYAGFNIPCI